MIKILIFIFGLCVGSFLNCLIYRMEQKKNLLGRSFCPNCKHKLGFFDLIPILSFIFLRARCRYCHKRISLQYPLVELFTGILFVLLFSNSLITTIYLFFIACVLIIVFVYDLKHYLIPDKLVYLAIVVIFVYQLFHNNLSNCVLSGLVSGLFFFFLWLVSQGKFMGSGDIGLGVLIGLFLGFPNIIVALFSAFLIGAIIGIVLILMGKKGLKSQVPFAPFLVIGTFIALFWGQYLINLYL